MNLSIMTEQEEIEALRDEIEHYRYFFENSPMGIYRTTPEGKVVLGNAMLVKMLGYSSFEELRAALNLEQGGFEERYPRAAFKKKIEKIGAVQVSEAAWRRKDGSIIYIRENAQVVRDAHGNIKFYEGTVEDITELKKLDKTRDDFISTAAHELRTPLTALQGYLSLLEKEGPALPPKVQNYAAKLARAAGKLHEIVEDLLSVLRLEHKSESELVPFDIQPIMNEAVGEWLIKAKNENKEVIVQQPHEHLVYGDPSRTKKIISNLVGNAVKYTPEKGRILISAVKALDENEQVLKVTVEDNGIGILKEHQDMIFGKFYRVPSELSVKAGGTGLGLYIVKQLVEIQGGRIWVESAPGQGSKFTFTIPLREENQQLPLLGN